MNDVTLLLSLQKIYSWYFHSSEIDIFDNNPLQRNISRSIDPIRNLSGDPIRKPFLQGGVDIKCHMQFPATRWFVSPTMLFLQPLLRSKLLPALWNAI